MAENSGHDEKDILSAVGSRTILNLLCKVLFRLLHFILNGLIFRNISSTIIGIANVRLQLLYSTILFLSREAFRRTVPKFNDLRSIPHYINLTWLTIPASFLITSVVLPSIMYIQSDHAEEQPYYYHACCFYALAAIIELCSEPLYLLVSLTRNYQINIYIEMFASTIGFTLQALLVYRNGQSALYFYGLGYVIYSSLITLTYYIYFLTRKKTDRRRLFIVKTFSDLFVKIMSPCLDHQLFSETVTFLKQGVFMKLLTEGERYILSLFSLVPYKDQAVFDVINNLGSVLPRLVFSTLEESAYTYFQQTLTRKQTSSKCKEARSSMEINQSDEKRPLSADQRTIILNAFQFFTHLLRFVIILSLLVISFGIPYSRFFLSIYGGSNLADGSGPALLRLYCVYLFFIAINGVTEAFSQATMSLKQLSKYRNFMFIFALIYLSMVYLLTKSIGVCGILLANCFNMLGRIIVNSCYIYRYFPQYTWSNIYAFPISYFLSMIGCSLICCWTERWIDSPWLHFGLGSILGSFMLFLTWRTEREMIHYMYCVFRLKRTKN